MPSYTTPTLVQNELRAAIAFASTTNPSLATVTEWIDEESSQIDDDLGYILESTSYDDLIDYKGEDYLYMKTTPIITVDTLLYNTSTIGSNDYSTAWVTKTEDTHFFTEQEKGRLGFIFKKFAPRTGQKQFRAIYTAGYATIPKVYQKLATKIVALRSLNSLISQNVNETNDGGSISVGSINIVEPSSYGVASYRQLEEDITKIQDKLTDGFGVRRFYDY